MSTLTPAWFATSPIFNFDIALRGDELWWDATVVDDPIARQILDEFYDLPETVAAGPAALQQRFAERGLDVVGFATPRA